MFLSNPRPARLPCASERSAVPCNVRCPSQGVKQATRSPRRELKMFLKPSMDLYSILIVAHSAWGGTREACTKGQETRQDGQRGSNERPTYLRSESAVCWPRTRAHHQQLAALVVVDAAEKTPTPRGGGRRQRGPCAGCTLMFASAYGGERACRVVARSRARSLYYRPQSRVSASLPLSSSFSSPTHRTHTQPWIAYSRMP